MQLPVFHYGQMSVLVHDCLHNIDIIRPEVFLSNSHVFGPNAHSLEETLDLSIS